MCGLSIDFLFIYLFLGLQKAAVAEFALQDKESFLAVETKSVILILAFSWFAGNRLEKLVGNSQWGRMLLEAETIAENVVLIWIY